PSPKANAAALPAHFLLAGDSTTAPQSSGGGGWGNGFLAYLQPPATGKNLGHNGRTTVSYRSDGYWDEVLKEAKSVAGKKQVYVTIQFGHNDQKPDKKISIAQYGANLQKMAGEVKKAGGVPILVTPLTRRSFNGAKVKETFAEENKATVAAAEKAGAWWIDLNGASTEYVNKVGTKVNTAYALKSGDNTHVNAKGSKLFGRMVADLIVAKYPETKGFFKEDAAVSQAI
ncbi:GDSL-like Lipase/Acylhydrolase, partial [Eremomyces bilateralis CBS 781.70]